MRRWNKNECITCYSQSWLVQIGEDLNKLHSLKRSAVYSFKTSLAPSKGQSGKWATAIPSFFPFFSFARARKKGKGVEIEKTVDFC